MVSEPGLGQVKIAASDWGSKEGGHNKRIDDGHCADPMHLGAPGVKAARPKRVLRTMRWSSDGLFGNGRGGLWRGCASRRARRF